MIHLWRGAVTCTLSLSVWALLVMADLESPDPIPSAPSGYQVRPAASAAAGPDLESLLAGEDPDDVYISIAFEYENMGDYGMAIKYLKKVLTGLSVASLVAGMTGAAMGAGG